MKKAFFVLATIVSLSSTGYAQTQNQHHATQPLVIHHLTQPQVIDTPEVDTTRLRDYDEHNRMNRNDTVPSEINQHRDDMLRPNRDMQDR